ncbi:glycoside hydrolase family 5 protein [Lyophyllum atratum]|nr:glycoside hydrolase family 5 protein [Lyophyllum atratum]KAF8060675.1 glycoside hydrolase family 5 protein [Lyophyllum atratum]
MKSNDTQELEDLSLTLCSPTSVFSTPAQTFHGIGGSGAWWPNDLYKFPDARRQKLSTLLFFPSGSGLSSYRYNIGAGSVNVSNPTCAPETFYVSPGVHNFARDAQGVYFFPEAAKRGVQHLTAFANSAPAPLTSGKASCNGGFVTGSGAAYVTYLADIIAHFQQEPDSMFGPSRCGHEGMQVQPTQRAEVFNGLHNALSAKGLTSSVGILTDESSSLGNAGNDYTSFISNTNRLYPGKATWIGKDWSGGYDPTVKNALILVLANEPRYDEGLNYYDPNYATNKNFALYIKKQFWTYKHSGNFVKLGSQRRPIIGSDAKKFTMAV